MALDHPVEAAARRNPMDEPPYELQKLLGFDVTECTEGYARVEMPLAGLHNNRNGTPHGGIFALLMDSAAGFCGVIRPAPLPPARVMTLSLTMNCVSRPRGARLIAEARRVGGGARSYFTDMTLKDELGELIATGSAVLRYRTDPG